MTSAHSSDVDLSNCDRERIHELGAIQDFGALVAINNDWIIAHVSENFAELLGSDKQPSEGDKLANYLSPSACAELRSLTATLVWPDQVERLFGVQLGHDEAKYDVALHRSGTNTIIEFEPHSEGDMARQFALLRPIIGRLERANDLISLCDEAARQLRLTLKMDRVMVYRFHPDDSGEVIAEARNEDLEGFKGLRYPRSDIPVQARALYLRNRFRIISDVEAPRIAIEPALSILGEPLDLSMSTLRAVSPIHLEYLRNMGVRASLSISIIVGGKLWGLFACHHYSPKVLAYSQRTAAELFSELVSLIIERTLMREDEMLRDDGARVHDKLMRDIASGTALAKSLPLLTDLIQTVIPHDGASLFVEENYDSRGAAPNEEEFRAILPQLNGAASSRILAVDALAERVPRAARFADRAAGALVIPVSRTPRDHLVLWRKPLNRIVTWAGEPAKAVTHGPNGTRLSPRESFAAWQETVEGHGEEWKPNEIKIAEGLRVTLLEIILRLTDEAMVERARNQQQQELLIAELNHRVRNILNLIRGVVSQSRSDAQDIEEFSRIIGGRISALASAHDNITMGNWSAAPFRALVESESNAYLAGQADRVVMRGPEVMISPEAYTVVAMVIHEMMTNSAKYGSLTDRSGKLSIETAALPDGGLAITWRESGGPPVKPPQRRGFGTVIIDRSIPHELGGTSSVSYNLEGVEARFTLPARVVSWQDEGKTIMREESKARSREGLPKTLPESILLVEDSMIIALDTEDCLRELGIGTIMIESTVAGALSCLESNTPALALLDYNLGKESSEAVAEELAARGIPFWLATGYGEMRDRLGDLGAAGLLVKPYGKDQLIELISDFAAIR